MTDQILESATDADALTLPEITITLGEMTKTIHACQGLTSDLLGMMVALDPASMASLRDDAFRRLSAVHRLGPTYEAADYLEGFYRIRAEMLEVVLGRAGRPWLGTPLIDLAEERAARS